MRRRVAITVLVLAVGIAAVIALGPTRESRLASIVADLRARGEPVTLAEVEPPMPPEGENGADDLRAAVAWFEARDWSDAGVAWEIEPWSIGLSLDDSWERYDTPEKRAALRRALALLGPFFEHVDRAMDKPEIAWELGPRNSVETVVGLHGLDAPPTERERVLDKVEWLLDVRMRHGEAPEDRLAGIRAALALSRRQLARGHPDWTRGRVLFTRACRALRGELTAGRIESAAVREELDALLATDWDAQFQRLYRGGRADLLEMYPYFFDGSAQELNGWAYSRGWSRARDTLRGVLQGGRPGPFSNEPESLTFQGIRQSQRYLEPGWDARRMHVEHMSRPEDSDVLSGLRIIRGSLVRCDAVGRMARIALAADEHRRLHGAWPSTSGDLAPLFPEGVPLDPYTAAPFVMERDGEGLILRAQPWEGVVDARDPEEAEQFVWRLPPR